jgi:hypothetical protein
VAGLYYYAIHPGMPPFTVNLGRLLKNDDFRAYVQKTAATGKLEIRTEQIDDTYVVFVVNGSAGTVKTQTKLDLTNLSSSSGNPVNLTVPALSEMFLTLLNPLDPLESYGCSSIVSPIK